MREWPINSRRFDESEQAPARAQRFASRTKPPSRRRSFAQVIAQARRVSARRPSRAGRRRPGRALPNTSLLGTRRGRHARRSARGPAPGRRAEEAPVEHARSPRRARPRGGSTKASTSACSGPVAQPARANAGPRGGRVRRAEHGHGRGTARRRAAILRSRGGQGGSTFSREEAPHPLRVLQREQEADVAAPVVSGDGDLVRRPARRAARARRASAGSFSYPSAARRSSRSRGGRARSRARAARRRG